MKAAIAKIKEQVHASFGGRKKWAHIVLFLLVVLYAGQGLFFPATIKRMGATYGFYAGFVCFNLLFYIGISYTFLLVLLPLLYTRRSKLLFWLAFIGNIILWIVVKAIIYKLWVKLFPAMDAMPALRFGAILSRFIQDLYFFVLFLFVYYFIDIYSHQREIRQLERLKTEKIMLETSLLKSQINPHFLFNTLNNIYALSLVRSPETRNIIARLRSLLHYMLYDCQAEVVPLEQEIAFMNSYLSLEKIRHKEEQCTVTVHISGDVAGKQVAPLLLINFLENAFKHGVKSGIEKSWITMNIDVQQASMQFDLRNSKPAVSGAGLAINEYTGGIGIQNVKRRLELLYPGKHVLQIDEQPGSFHVALQVKF